MGFLINSRKEKRNLNQYPNLK